MIITDKKITYFDSENPVEHFANYCYKIIFEIIEDDQKMIDLQDEIDFIINKFEEDSKNRGEEIYNPFSESELSLYLDFNKMILKPVLQNYGWVHRRIENYELFSINKTDSCLNLNIEFRTIYNFQDLISFISSNILERKLMKNSEFFRIANRFFSSNDSRDNFNALSHILKTSFFSLDNEIGRFLIQLALKKTTIHSYSGIKLLNTFLSNYQGSVDELYYDLKEYCVDFIEILSKLKVKEIDSLFRAKSYLLDLQDDENIKKVCNSLKEKELEQLIVYNINRIISNNNYGLWFENYKELFNQKLKIVIQKTPNEMISSYNGEEQISHLRLFKKFVENKTIDCIIYIIDGANKNVNSSNFDHLFSAEPWLFLTVADYLINSGFLFDDNSLKLIEVYKLIDSSKLLYVESASFSSITENSNDLIEDALYKAKSDAESDLEIALLDQERVFEEKIEKLESIIDEKDSEIDNLNEQLSDFI